MELNCNWCKKKYLTDHYDFEEKAICNNCWTNAAKTAEMN